MMLTYLASAAADSNHESRQADDPARSFTPEERAARLAIVRRAVESVESLPDSDQYRPKLAASLSQLGAFDEALQVARTIDRSKIAETGQIDATWALWRISLDQIKAGKLEAARATLREAARGIIPKKADDHETQIRLGTIFARMGDLDEARLIAETLDPKNRAEILSLVAKHKLRSGDRDEAAFLFRRALEVAEQFRKDLRLTGAPVPYTQALALIARIHARAGDWSSAMKKVNEIPPEEGNSRDLKDITAYFVVGSRAYSGDMAGALNMARAIEAPSVRVWAIRGLASAIYEDRSLSDF
jgi:tetratricopeptide (TPR) repeat protein